MRFLSAWLRRAKNRIQFKRKKKEMNMPKEMGMSKEMGMNGRGGHLYMQTNEVKNAIIHYHRSANGTLTEVERVATGGVGSGTFKPYHRPEGGPNSFLAAGGAHLSPGTQVIVR